MHFPKSGLSKESVLEALQGRSADDADWRGGRTFSLVYFAGDEVLEVLGEAYRMYLSTNGLSPFAFQSLRRFEEEVVAATAELLHGGPGAVGTMTSGGTESILMAVKAARDRLRAERGIDRPKMVVPITAHPAFEKAAHYLEVEVAHVPLREDLRADPEAARALVDERTILMVGSAPAYPHGVVDPIPELAAIAQARGLPFHVDACLGGFLLPFFERLGEAVPPWDFRVPGVTSISADLHKYGYAARGASTVVYRDDSYRKHQFFAYTGWPGGLYGSPSMSGSRPGGAIAAAWAVLHFLGEDGYLALARRTLETTRLLIDGVGAIPGLQVLGRPDMSVFAFAASDLDIYVLGEAMQRRGWHLDAQQLPPALHLMVTPAHARVVEPFLSDLRSAVEEVRGAETSAPSGAAALYGMVGALGDPAPVREVIVDLMCQLLPARG